MRKTGVRDYFVEAKHAPEAIKISHPNFKWSHGWRDKASNTWAYIDYNGDKISVKPYKLNWLSRGKDMPIIKDKNYE
ncbi:MAG: hypothetical protein ABIG69_06955 [Bacteroidota bacterium]